MLFGERQPTAHVGGGAACGDANQAVLGTEAPLDEIGTSGGLNVLKPFRAAQQRGGATGENPLNLLGITAEGGRTFRGIQHPQPSGGASTQVEEPAAGTEALSNRINRLG